jgi:hypothetical protein
MRLLVSMATGVIAAVGYLSGIPQAAADDLACVPGTGCFFLSPSGNISCELDEAAPPGTQGSAALAYCQSISPPQSARLDEYGSLTPCAGDSCLGNPPQGTPTLAYGQTARHGPFSCLSESTGITCKAPSGQGFTISRSGITAVG